MVRRMRHTAVVTGAGRGIGRAIVERLAPEAWVAGLDVAFADGPGAAQWTRETDVADSRAVAAAIECVLQMRGGIDWVVCAAGITRDHVSWKMDDAAWRDVVAVNLTGAFNTARAAAAALRRSSAGRLVFISSINGVRGSFGQTNYAAAKAGIIGLARSLALELAHDGVTVNVVAPGFINTAMTQHLPEASRRRALDRTPLGRWGNVDDVAHTVRFLCDDATSFITGAVIPVDGGQLLGSTLA
jgi:NAD(P)-dependent dehydrogenase (short-subunit alcohol dehydrogenase family)